MNMEVRIQTDELDIHAAGDNGDEEPARIQLRLANR